MWADDEAETNELSFYFSYLFKHTAVGFKLLTGQLLSTSEVCDCNCAVANFTTVCIVSFSAIDNAKGIEDLPRRAK